ncbi:MAG TPA: hypothetical protein P5572_02495 [Phycisphaerae bacterium]|nr:hypothetical protein [Phycisphaerales bacterium]HRX83870.1 hypothetical protein [Phycisphaerae bacterium]
MHSWQQKGCTACRRAWETGQPPPEIAIDVKGHTALHRCAECGSYWEQHERYADVITEEAARQRYPNAFEPG